MRLRQAHAMLETAKAIKEAGLGFEFYPFDYDQFGAAPCPDDYMTGFAEFTDPDRPDSHARVYHADVTPGPGPFDVSVRVVFGYLDDGVELVSQLVQVAAVDEDDNVFASGFAERVAARVARAVREWESTYEDAYRERVAQSGGAA